MPKKRSNGEGALRKRQNGLWECMIMTGFQPNGKRKYKSFYARTQREVLQKVKDYQTAIDSLSPSGRRRGTMDTGLRFPRPHTRAMATR